MFIGKEITNGDSPCVAEVHTISEWRWQQIRMQFLSGSLRPVTFLATFFKECKGNRREKCTQTNKQRQKHGLLPPNAVIEFWRRREASGLKEEQGEVRGIFRAALRRSESRRKAEEKEAAGRAPYLSPQPHALDFPNNNNKKNKKSQRESHPNPHPACRELLH